MSDHESVRQLLALSAAGLLDAGEERLVREHARQCAACAAQLDEFASLSAGLSALPAPQPPTYLLARTTMLLAAEADRRQGAAFAAAAAIFALVLVLLIGQTLRMVAGDTAALAWLLWAVITSVFGAASALVLASRRRLERSIV
ncbi:MAG: zf-HC2 domain-containing protein [Nevskiales bacterium]